MILGVNLGVNFFFGGGPETWRNKADNFAERFAGELC